MPECRVDKRFMLGLPLNSGTREWPWLRQACREQAQNKSPRNGPRAAATLARTVGNYTIKRGTRQANGSSPERVHRKSVGAAFRTRWHLVVHPTVLRYTRPEANCRFGGYTCGTCSPERGKAGQVPLARSASPSNAAGTMSGPTNPAYRLPGSNIGPERNPCAAPSGDAMYQRIFAAYRPGCRVIAARRRCPASLRREPCNSSETSPPC